MYGSGQVNFTPQILTEWNFKLEESRYLCLGKFQNKFLKFSNEVPLI
jgi:hypothetical protein